MMSETIEDETDMFYNATENIKYQNNLEEIILMDLNVKLGNRARWNNCRYGLGSRNKRKKH